MILIALIAAQSPGEERITIAILDLEASGVSTAEAVSITNRIRNELFLTGRYKVVERGAMQEILTEVGFQMAGCTSSECIVQAGRILGVQQMVAGSLDKLGQLYTINLRMINVETGEILAVASADCRDEIEDVALKSTKEAVEKLTGVKIPIENEPIIPIKKEIKSTKFRNLGMKVGIKIGCGRSYISGNTNVHIYSIYGPSASIFLYIPLSAQFGFQPEITGIGKGADMDGRYELNYCKIESSIKYLVKSFEHHNYQIGAGLYYGTLSYDADYVKSFDMGFILDVGANFEIYKHDFIIEIKRYFGSIDIAQDSSGNYFLGGNHNYTLVLSIGYYF